MTGDLTAPVDAVHADCVAVQRIIDGWFDREAESIARRAAAFAAFVADIEVLVAGADGWDPAVRLAEQAVQP